MLLFYKLLNRIGLLKLFDFNTSLKIGAKQVKIPLVGGLGLAHFNHNPWLFKLLQILPTSKSVTVIDIGVNIGQSLVEIKTALPNSKYIGFEPNSHCMKYLKELLHANNFEDTEVLPFGVSDTSSTQSLYFNSKTDSTATLVEEFRPGRYNDGHKETVNTIDLDSYFPHKFTTEVLLKMDIEGSEYLALKVSPF